MVVQNNIGAESSWSPTLPKVVDELGVECGVIHSSLSTSKVIYFLLVVNKI
jgi:hypothetical protein